MKRRTLLAILVAAGLTTGRVSAQDSTGLSSVSELQVPGGIRGALDATHDPLAADRAHFLPDLIRRTYDAPIRERNDPRALALQALVARLRASPQQGTATPADTLPLPLTPEIWTDVVFNRRLGAPDLLAAIVQSRQAALFYIGLLSLDDGTRAWIGSQPALIREIVGRFAVAFQIAAPGLSVAGGRATLPGGPSAVEGWEALIGRRADAPAEFISGLLSARQGRLAYFVGAMAQLTPAQLRWALALDTPDAEARMAVMRRMADIFDRLAVTWNLEQHAFWRPARDPSLLVADLRTDGSGRPMVPGTRAFWHAVFETPAIRDREESGALTEGDAVDFGWLCEQIFDGNPTESHDRYYEVLFASRLVDRITPGNAADAAAAVRSIGRYPALAAELERSGLRDVGAYAAAARRAARLSATGDRTRVVRALAQFQGTLALVTRGVRRGSLRRGDLAPLVTSLSSVEPTGQGDYEARLVRWIQQQLGNDPERTLVQLVSGPERMLQPDVEWEGTSYRVDIAGAEARRIARLLGDEHEPYFSTAVQLADQSDAAAGRDVERLRLAADDQLARGLLELAYAIALGDPDRTPVPAAELAARHDFGFESRYAGPWSVAAVGSDAEHGWHAIGSILGLDVALAGRALTRASAGPLSRAPTLNGPDRLAFVEAAVLVEPASLADNDRDAIAAAIRKGRERVGAVQTAADTGRLAEQIHLAPARRTLLLWTAAHEPARLEAFFSPVELFWLGGGEAGPLQAWGAPAGPRLGCLCLQMTGPHAWEALSGRWSAGLLASAFPDLNLRLAELLADLRMPASLLASVLGSATLDLADSAGSRDGDDRRALVEFVQALRQEQVEQYLALLTTGGPLVPVGDGR